MHTAMHEYVYANVYGPSPGLLAVQKLLCRSCHSSAHAHSTPAPLRPRLPVWAPPAPAPHIPHLPLCGRVVRYGHRQHQPAVQTQPLCRMDHRCKPAPRRSMHACITGVAV
eukprot:362150-Chlamydomonas_euryale.AAC.4